MAKIKTIDERLYEWADFVRDNKKDLLFANKSPEQQTAGGGDVSDGYMPEHVVLMELAVLQLPVDCREAVKAKYMGCQDNQADQARQLSAALKKKISRRRFSEMIYYSHLFIAGIYTGLEMAIEKSVDNAAQKP
ncbi:MAG: hypothetical protein OEY66_07065 [Gammaproteobacteria bacterium]|nr:hypothetical protein [Gammaproteobacteria bacterium]